MTGNKPTLDDVLSLAQERLAAGDASGIAQSQEALVQYAEAALQAGREAINDAAKAVSAAFSIAQPQPEYTERVLWPLQRQRGDFPFFFSEAYQDRFLYENVFGDRRGGVFVDVGAYDGVVGSNTLFFEKFLGWSGLCIEPDPVRYARLKSLRSVPCLRTCIADRDGSAEFLQIRNGLAQMGGMVETYDPAVLQEVAARSTTDVVTVPTRTLNAVLDEHGITSVDYLSIDTEGAELSILRSLDFERFAITALSIENARHAPEIGDLLRHHGYQQVRRLGADDIYVRAA